MDLIIKDFTNMRIEHNPDFSNLQIVPSNTRTPCPRDIICALYLENKRLKQEIAQLKALIFTQQPNIPHWVK